MGSVEFLKSIDLGWKKWLKSEWRHARGFSIWWDQDEPRCGICGRMRLYDGEPFQLETVFATVLYDGSIVKPMPDEAYPWTICAHHTLQPDVLRRNCLTNEPFDWPGTPPTPLQARLEDAWRYVRYIVVVGVRFLWKLPKDALLHALFVHRLAGMRAKLRE